MNILHLKYAAEVARTGSLRKASENLFIGQPNLSRAVKELEQSLGITIFKRVPRGMVPTPEGEEFLRYANRILAQIDEVERLYQKSAPARQRFSISVPRASYISDAFVRFSQSIDPDVPAELFYKETNAMRAIKNIVEADYRLGIIRYAENFERYFRDLLEEKGLTHDLVTQFRYVLLLSKDHPLADRDDLCYDDLKPYTEIAHADPFVPFLSLSTVRQQELPGDIDKRIYVFERSSQFELLSENTSTFMWVSAVPERLLERYGLVQKTCIDTGRVYCDVLIHSQDYRLTDLDQRFVRELFRSKERILDPFSPSPEARTPRGF